ncbi:hypothetical protein BKH43_00135 [Helicobacter sp. 13S00401-1]|uniref:prenylated flavin chaperone LpdD n=1 Tax=Helicobacter sp. 13S00401-1 TaxID=1905758 RepID=UPI000BA54E25|nr:hypothetical protein [Helicobacter sp. 13S00401-1]PAF51687.1 hypothetical protein BKH43_00135 [Helicobacter sp. 13S00401-1]
MDSFELVKICKDGTKTFDITFKAVLCGKDLNLNIYGGDKAHIGASSLAYIKLQDLASLKDKNYQAIEVKTIEIPGHKEALLSERLAFSLCESLQVSVQVNCGIHLDNIQKSMIEKICKLVLESKEEIARLYKDCIS